MDAETLRRAIQAAFGGESHPGWDNIWYLPDPQNIYEFKMIESSIPSGTHWKDVPKRALGNLWALRVIPTAFPYFVAAYLWKMTGDSSSLGTADAYFSRWDQSARNIPDMAQQQMGALSDEQFQVMIECAGYFYREYDDLSFAEAASRWAQIRASLRDSQRRK